MIRMQVRLEESDYAQAKQEAKALGIPMAEFARRAIREFLSGPKNPPWMRYAGFVESGDVNSSGLVDTVVYGTKE